jgi:hypothetical protein
MEARIIFKIQDHISRQLDMINSYALNNKGGLTEVEAISAIAGRNTLIQLRDYLKEEFPISFEQSMDYLLEELEIGE